MKSFISVIIFIASIVLALYLGVYLLFIGGIVDIIDQVKSEHTESMAVAIGVVKIVFAAPIGWLTFYLGGFGSLMLGFSSKKRSRPTFRGL